MQRIRLRVRIANAAKAPLPGWQVVRNGETFCSFPRKGEAVCYARRIGYEMAEDGLDVELAIVDEVGMVELEQFCRAPHWASRFEFGLAAEAG